MGRGERSQAPPGLLSPAPVWTCSCPLAPTAARGLASLTSSDLPLVSHIAFLCRLTSWNAAEGGGHSTGEGSALSGHTRDTGLCCPRSGKLGPRTGRASLYPLAGPTPRAGGEGMVPTAPTPIEAQRQLGPGAAGTGRGLWRQEVCGF